MTSQERCYVKRKRFDSIVDLLSIDEKINALISIRDDILTIDQDKSPSYFKKNNDNKAKKHSYQKSDLPKVCLSLHSSSLDLHNYLRKVRHLSIQSRIQFIIATLVTKPLPTKWIEMKPQLPQTHLASAEGEITMLLDVYFTDKVTGSKLAGNSKT